MVKLLTIDGENFDKNNVLPEYPRPNFVRDSYINLNGPWKCKISKSNSLDQKLDREIVVPYPVESILSGINEQIDASDCIIYERDFVFPDHFRSDQVLLNFEAVDYKCFVYVNKTYIGYHEGGYLPFSFNITSALHYERNSIQVVVQDDTYNKGNARGKQAKESGGMWYTPCSGIWQTVWMESVMNGYMKNVRITPNIDNSTVNFEIDCDDEIKEGNILITFDNAIVVHEAFSSNQFTISIPNQKLWTPETPNLYEVKMTTSCDVVTSYFGMRKVSVGESKYGRCILLNNTPYFNNGLLDQGYFPDGNMTPASDTMLRNDIISMKTLGFNMLRKHIKRESRRFYYHCDKIGMLVWQDMVNGGKYDYFSMTVLPTLRLQYRNDHAYHHFGRNQLDNRATFVSDMRETIKLLYNHPSIVVWVPFNEGWGQFDAKMIARMIKKIDSTRLVDHASGWFDQGGGDLRSLHIYFRKLKVHHDHHYHRPVVVSEFGGYSHSVKDHIYNPSNEYGYTKFPALIDFQKRFNSAYLDEVIPQIKRGLCATVYTQVSDVEDETNGLLTYDRKVLKVDVETTRQIMEKVKI